MPVPKPRKGENTQSFISRCISRLAKTDPRRPKRQRVAMCYTAARSAGRKVRKTRRK